MSDNPSKKKSRSKPVLERLLAKRRIDDATGCWIWTGAVSKGHGQWERLSGYGYIRDTATGDGQAPLMLVHRVAFRELKGPIPEGQEIDHICVNRKCFNPEHLQAVTHKENCELMAERRADAMANDVGDYAADPFAL